MFLWLLTFYQTGPNGLFIFYQVFNLILQSAIVKIYDNSKNFRILYQRIETEVKLCKKDIPQWVQSIIIQDKVN